MKLPPPDTRAARLETFADELRAKPGEWEILPRQGLSETVQSMQITARRIRTSFRKQFRPAGHFDARVRKYRGKNQVFVRYVGPDGMYGDTPEANGGSAA